MVSHRSSDRFCDVGNHRFAITAHTFGTGDVTVVILGGIVGQGHVREFAQDVVRGLADAVSFGLAI